MTSALPPTYDQIMEAVAACGVSAENIRIVYADELQSDVVIIRDLGGADEDRFRCIRRAIHPFYVIEIEVPDRRLAYYRFSASEDEREERAEAIQWLRRHGALDRVPRYDPANGLESFARDVEAACSLPPGSALEAIDSSALTFRQDFLGSLPQDRYDEFELLRRVIAASNAGEQGIRLAFVGNEAISGEGGP